MSSIEKSLLEHKIFKLLALKKSLIKGLDRGKIHLHLMANDVNYKAAYDKLLNKESKE